MTKRIKRLRLCVVLPALFVFCGSSGFGLILQDLEAARPTSKLWEQYREARLSGEEPVLADFSYVGYHTGLRPLPGVEWEVFDVTSYGAVPDDGRSDREALKRAISAAEANGSGVVFFPKGRFRINDLTDPHNRPIIVNSSRIVLRGSGSGDDGTELFAERHMDPTNPKQMWTCPFILQFRGRGPLGAGVRLSSNAGRETRVVELVRGHDFKPDDWVILELQNNSPEVVAKAVAPYVPDPKWTHLTEKGVMIKEFHQIEKVVGNRITFKEPIHSDILASDGWRVVRYLPIEEVGFEEIAFTGNWHEVFVHHKSAIHDSGWSGLELAYCVNSWIRNCRFTDWNRVARVSRSSAVTVEDLLIDGNLGHNAVSLQHTSHTMVRNVEDIAGHYHASGLEGMCSGNVFHECEYRSDTCYEAHASQPRWTLFDNVTGGWMYGRWGGAEHNQPNHLRGLVFWNYKNTGSGVAGKYHFMRPDSKYGRVIMPYVIGFHGNRQDWEESAIEVLESNGRPVYPESLYEAQFDLRMEVMGE